jgi:hypothetical protein
MRSTTMIAMIHTRIGCRVDQLVNAEGSWLISKARNTMSGAVTKSS